MTIGQEMHMYGGTSSFWWLENISMSSNSEENPTGSSL